MDDIRTPNHLYSVLLRITVGDEPADPPAFRQKQRKVLPKWKRQETDKVLVFRCNDKFRGMALKDCKGIPTTLCALHRSLLIIQFDISGEKHATSRYSSPNSSLWRRRHALFLFCRVELPRLCVFLSPKSLISIRRFREAGLTFPKTPDTTFHFTTDWSRLPNHTGTHVFAPR
ncbi:hypothetical protein M404DRAFT_10846 [Pisolithus tinctorius Marx 270]|uniref:Uncharacterized protein n=1 Tax=Pisolithus tinctorius Marx 270 TaxID=870435 RepID=A0A0C3NNR0_PISTI|nr:hypothetical protein M404DRAFT_10846 [Pisolithus tinctorius Marx 270]